jgi:hypothetical protein
MNKNENLPKQDDSKELLNDLAKKMPDAKNKIPKEVATSPGTDLKEDVHTLKAEPLQEKNSSEKNEFDGIVIGEVEYPAETYKGDTITHVLSVIETVITELRKSGQLQVVSKKVNNKVYSMVILKD